jgi:hypothetical protein
MRFFFVLFFINCVTALEWREYSNFAHQPNYLFVATFDGDFCNGTTVHSKMSAIDICLRINSTLYYSISKMQSKLLY